jgi:hypothetical protein
VGVVVGSNFLVCRWAGRAGAAALPIFPTTSSSSPSLAACGCDAEGKGAMVGCGPAGKRGEGWWAPPTSFDLPPPSGKTHQNVRLPVGPTYFGTHRSVAVAL